MDINSYIMLIHVMLMELDIMCYGEHCDMHHNHRSLSLNILHVPTSSDRIDNRNLINHMYLSDTIANFWFHLIYINLLCLWYVAAFSPLFLEFERYPLKERGIGEGGWETD